MKSWFLDMYRSGCHVFRANVAVALRPADFMNGINEYCLVVVNATGARFSVRNLSRHVPLLSCTFHTLRPAVISEESPGSDHETGSWLVRGGCLP